MKKEQNAAFDGNLIMTPLSFSDITYVSPLTIAIYWMYEHISLVIETSKLPCNSMYCS
jgi:hypothetical protein